MSETKQQQQQPSVSAEDEDMGARIDYSALKPGLKRFPSFIERYTTQRFHTTERGEDEWVCQHSNKLILVGIAPTHPIVAVAGRSVAKVDFAASGSREKSLLDMKVSGKGKKGGVWVQRDTALCEVTMSDGAVYKVRACVRGTLIEVNARLAEDPGLLQRKANTEGYVAIIRPKLDEADMTAATAAAQGLLSRDEYCALRGVPPSATTN